MRRLQEEVSELQDLVRSLSLSVQYGEAEPFEAFLTRHGIAGRRRSALHLTLDAVLARALGQDPHPLSAHALEDLSEFADPLRQAGEPGPVTRGEALRILAQVVGSTELAEEALEAHRARGFALEAHAAL
ncbi:hypothetical protein SAMN05445756_2007 [Kytococcus aerolatus]|uniref:Uncharacterized protein n=1 Tax=Kytococcus aerolatus TaxID=592308 RepID=A0A212U5I5_9MICO|nr:hypothetical protein [Kytococcus aerolatus]SNC73523.1 hypothetical protein SAMN05445756_2007 [Kytococcus aerolatus]